MTKKGLNCEQTLKNTIVEKLNTKKFGNMEKKSYLCIGNRNKSIGRRQTSVVLNIMDTNNFSVQVVNAKEINAVKVLSNSLTKGASAQVVTFKETKMNKGTKNNRNPFLGRVMERLTIGGWVVGTNYKRSCQNAADRCEGSEFKEDKSWHTYYNDFFETDKATHSKYYLQLQRSAGTGHSEKKDYFVDGRPATDEEVKTIKSWLPKSSNNQPSTQVAAGIDAEHERMYRCVTLSNIETITQGGFKYRICKVEAPATAYAK